MANGASELSATTDKELFSSARAKAQEAIYRFVTGEEDVDVWDDLRVLIDTEIRSRHWWALRSISAGEISFAAVLTALSESGDVPTDVASSLREHWAILSASHHTWESRPIEEQRAIARSIVSDLYF